jgi:excinuclease ABC subunit A
VEPRIPPEIDQPDTLVRVRDARVHNLRGVDVDVPRNALVVFTGVSGSGKSSLAFDTIFAEAQRRYFESIAPYARRLLQQVTAPKVGSITGLPPAVAMQQQRSVPGSRSSVGTVSTIGTTLRMLLSRAGDYPTDITERLDSDAFSPNTAAGACPTCHGLGVTYEVTEQSLVPDPTLSIRERAVAAWPGAWQGKNYRDILAVLGHDVDAPWHTLATDVREWILFTDEQPVVTVHAEREAHRIQRPYQGTYMSARRYVLKALTMSQSSAQRRRALQFVEQRACTACGGTRLRPDALRVTFLGRTIAELGAMQLTELATLLRPVAEGGDASEDAAVQLCGDVVRRIEPIVGLGLGYLALDRPAPTLSAGELQRVRLASQLRAGLFGVAYVLDEPSAGLHPADAEPLVDVLEQLVAAGNSMLVVEHHMGLARRAAWLVDVGPGAGEAGGLVLHSGPVDGLRDVEQSITRRFLFPDSSSPTTPPADSPVRAASGTLRLDGITHHNLRGVDLVLPLGRFTAVTGVSGSGKSSLVDALADALQGGLDPAAVVTGARESRDEDAEMVNPREGMSRAGWRGARGLEQVTRLVRVDQRPIGRTPRSNLATYTGLFDGVRKLFAATDLARERGWGAGRFSFNVDGGRCPTCQGEGFVAVELMFLPGTYAACAACRGSRYADETLDVRWNGRSIADVLALTVDEARDAFAGERGIRRTLDVLHEIGLGYLRLGQPATELSGGEAQRIKLASELQRARRGHALYVLDEPTTGLHPADVELLMAQLHRLVDAGHTVVVVEHDMDVVAGADHVIDLGPGAGDDGGRVVAQGTPHDVAAAPASRTAPYLAAALAR